MGEWSGGKSFCHFLERLRGYVVFTNCKLVLESSDLEEGPPCLGREATKKHKSETFLIMKTSYPKTDSMNPFSVHDETTVIHSQSAHCL